MDIDQIKKLAELSRIELTEEELAATATQFGSILAYVDKIKEANPAETYSLCGDDMNTFRDDIPREYDEAKRRILLAAFPDKEGDYLKVNTVLKND